MSADMSLTSSASRPGPGWAGRMVRSRAFAIGLSVVLHAGLFAVFYGLGFARPAARRVIIPEARLAAGPAPSTLTPDPPLKLTQAPAGSAATANQAPRLDELPILSVDTADAAGIEAAETLPLALPGVDVSGATSTSNLAGGSGPLGPVSRFFGQAGNAYKVVYVVDVSASLMIHIDQIIREMQDSIAGLVPSQEFHMVLAMPRQVREFAPKRLVPANRQYKTAAYDFIAGIAGVPEPGKADPIEAMSRAFAAKPELIYFLTDGDYPDVDAELEAVLKRLNAHGEVKITVIGFDPSPAPRALLERIARAHGGHCRFVEPR